MKLKVPKDQQYENWKGGLSLNGKPPTDKQLWAWIRDEWTRLPFSVRLFIERLYEAELVKLQRMKTHCEYCGGDYVATGVEVVCSCRLRQQLAVVVKENDGLRVIRDLVIRLFQFSWWAVPKRLREELKESSTRCQQRGGVGHVVSKD